MGLTLVSHRPLVAGIGISGSDGSYGTLTGLATRNSDDKKVLVTNLHTVSLSGWTVSGNEEIYQFAVSNANRVGRLYTNSWVPVQTGLLQNNTADVAALELLSGVDAKFALHSHPSHDERPIIAGVIEPRVGMTLTMLGATSGEGTVTVRRIDQTRLIGGTRFTGLTILRGDSSSSPATGGDSGAPCLLHVGGGRYRMSCIVFGGWHIGSNFGEGFAFPASVAEKELGITFGVPEEQLEPYPPVGEVQSIIRDAMSWVTHRVRNAPKGDGTNDPDKQVASMYPGWPLTAKVPPGHTMSGAQGDGDYVRHLGDEFVWRITPPLGPPPPPVVNDSIELELIHRRATSFRAKAKIRSWADGQPAIVLELRRDYQSDGRVQTEIHYAGKPAGDTRAYPVKVYFAGEEIISDHRTAQAGRVFQKTTWGESGLNSNKYFVRTENIPASKLMREYREGVKMRAFHLPLWNNDDDWDIHSSLFARGYDKSDGYMFENPPHPMYHDCSVGHRSGRAMIIETARLADGDLATGVKCAHCPKVTPGFCVKTGWD